MSKFNTNWPDQRSGSFFLAWQYLSYKCPHNSGHSLRCDASITASVPHNTQLGNEKMPNLNKCPARQSCSVCNRCHLGVAGTLKKIMSKFFPLFGQLA
ncbi:hypothetical protein CEXT_345011 [Caerostris extrusa]|uniref:Uncharacterized protein n=1 Tax=Caerostris extrusa TaxID=172846 RepID=A0AAV4PAJ2_CAEEX|nr:hypothetical protein CEXT_345011 [Caerostris extrusa]